MVRIAVPWGKAGEPEMNDSFYTKAAAIVLTAAGVLGVAYGIAKYVTDFEAAKSEIQNLRGQIAQLHEVLSKAQFGTDAGRIERLEKQVAELSKAREGAPVAAAAVAAKPSVAERLKAGGFDGVASDGKTRWPFRAKDVRLSGETFEAVVEWTTLNAEHRVKGRYSDATLFFKEVEFVRKGNNVLGCEYTLTSARADGLSGSYRNCDGNASGGTIDVTWW
jgi:hypothetical protein